MSGGVNREFIRTRMVLAFDGVQGVMVNSRVVVVQMRTA